MSNLRHIRRARAGEGGFPNTPAGIGQGTALRIPMKCAQKGDILSNFLLKFQNLPKVGEFKQIAVSKWGQNGVKMGKIGCFHLFGQKLISLSLIWHSYTYLPVNQNYLAALPVIE